MCRASLVRLILTFKRFACEQALSSEPGLSTCQTGEGGLKAFNGGVGERPPRQGIKDDGVPVALLVCAVRTNLARGTPDRHGTNHTAPDTLSPADMGLKQAKGGCVKRKFCR